MGWFVHAENIALFKRLLADPSTPAGRRKTVERLLAEEEAKYYTSVRHSVVWATKG